MAHRSGNATWQDTPSTATLVTAARLENVETAIDTHTHVAADVTDFDAAVGTKAEVATLNNAFGSTGGQPIKPWSPSKVIDRELWVTSNFETNTAGFPRSQSATLGMSLTGNSTEHGVRTLAKYIAPTGLPPYDNGSAFRLEFDYDGTAPTGGSWRISIACVDSGDVVVGQRQLVATDGSPTANKSGHFVHDFTLPGSTVRYVEVDLYMWNTVTAGTISVSNVTLKRTTAETRPILFAGQGLNEGGNGAAVARQIKDVPSNTWLYVEETLGSATAASDFYNYAYAYSNAYPWNSAQVWADPSWAQTYTWMGGAPGAATTITSSAVTVTKLRSTNNDQIIIAKNGAGTFEFRGNTHGGEVTAAGRTYKIDKGDGVWTDVTSRLGGNNLIPCRRLQWNWPTTITSSDQAGSPFANVSHLFTVFPDGVTRCDRTTTFNRSTEIGDYYEWMSSYDTTSPRIGRIGRGLTVIGNVDIFDKVATPATPTSSTATTGGTLAAATYSYRVSALSSDGESVPSVAKTQATTGTTSTVTVSWTAVTNATGYRVYGRSAGAERLLATVSSSTTSYVDTGSAVPVGMPQTISTARRPGVVSATSDAEDSDAATWAVWFDPITGWCHGNIYDREAVLSRSVVNGSFVRMNGDTSIVKQYNMLTWAGPAGSITVPSGTAWSATHWSIVYRPEDPSRYHYETAVRAASLTALKNVYPTT